MERDGRNGFHGRKSGTAKQSLHEKSGMNPYGSSSQYADKSKESRGRAPPPQAPRRSQDVLKRKRSEEFDSNETSSKRPRSEAWTAPWTKTAAPLSDLQRPIIARTTSDQRISSIIDNDPIDMLSGSNAGELSHKDPDSFPKLQETKNKLFNSVQSRNMPSMDFKGKSKKVANMQPRKLSIISRRDPMSTSHFSRFRQLQAEPKLTVRQSEEFVDCKLPIREWYKGLAKQDETLDYSLEWVEDSKEPRLQVITGAGRSLFAIKRNDSRCWKIEKDALMIVLIQNSLLARSEEPFRTSRLRAPHDNLLLTVVFRITLSKLKNRKPSLDAFLQTWPSISIGLSISLKAFEDAVESNTISHSTVKASPPPDTPSPRASISHKLNSSMSPLTSPPAPERSIATRRSTRWTSALQNSNQDDAPKSNGNDLKASEVVLVYPPTGTGSVQITQGDLNRLYPNEYLNDSLIDLALKLWQQDLREKDPQLADQIHVFSTFFYKKLKTGSLQEGYSAVRKWTTKVDIFNKQYLVIPINEHLHWYLAIIAYPANCLDPTPLPSSPARRSARASGKIDARNFSPARTVVSDDGLPLREGSTVETSTESAAAPEPIDLTNTQSQDLSDQKAQKQTQGAVQEIPLTYIFTFDSIGTGHNAAIKALQGYLAMEAQDKKAVDIGSKPKIKGLKVATPEQPNSCDCGVYVVQTVETFLASPTKFLPKIITTIKKDRLTEGHALWDTPSFLVKRERLARRIRALSREWLERKTIPKPLEPAPIPAPEQPPDANEQVSLRRPRTPQDNRSIPDDDDDDDVVVMDTPVKAKATTSRPRAGRSPKKNIGAAHRFR